MPAVERHCDVCVIGGSAAGLAAALQIARQHRSVIVVDDGASRDLAAGRLHGYLAGAALTGAGLTGAGLTGAALLTAGRAEVRGYGGEVITSHAERVTRDQAGGFLVEIGGGHLIIARRVLAATGGTDELPNIEGLAGHWGSAAFGSLAWQGYEFRDRRIVQVITRPAEVADAASLRHLTARLTVVIDAAVRVDDTEVDDLRAAGVPILRGRVIRVITGTDGHLAAVEVAGHGPVEAEVVVAGSRFRARGEPFAPLGIRLAPHPDGAGDVLETDPSGATAVPGLYAAGRVTDPAQQALQAAAEGSRVGLAISRSLASDDLRVAVRPSANEADWDRRYGGEQMWSGNPNGTLVAEVSGLPTGRALDVGAGEGGDAVWLAEQGWDVTASDISERALDRVRAAAVQRGLRVDCQRVDANALEAFPPLAFDLVSAQYASIPRTGDGRAVRNISGAVAPGGMLLIVSHDIEAMRQEAAPRSGESGGPGESPGHGHGHGHGHETGAGHGHGNDRPFDPDAYVRVDDFAAALTDSGVWDIEVHEVRPRPPGAASAAHHSHDIVLRARRRAT